ncbi:hypothetical protein D3Y59_02685 [Hymenobacter oligotrophus]|uniref:Uncharacterized protein n=1 Tax=Hymenobacter oligotrophus TaxID=2319843 RepID=A0A3B7R3Z9_9BACT|nr:hypothetical protein D3Y59_02685 [Hymenobacter oligotrophus]
MQVRVCPRCQRISARVGQARTKYLCPHRRAVQGLLPQIPAAAFAVTVM